MHQRKPEPPPTIQALQIDEIPPSRSGVDWAPLIFWICTLISFVGGGAILLEAEDAGGTVEHDNLRLIYAVCAGFFMFAAVFNEALVEHCWRRVALRALRGPMSGNHIRAASLSLPRVALRLVTCSLSGREFAVALGYLFLRGGTLAAVPLTQLSVRLIHRGHVAFQYHANVEVQRAGYMIIVAVIVHAASLALGLACVGLPPWAAFRVGYGQEALRLAYEPYLTAMPGGSIATAHDVAKSLDNSAGSSGLAKQHTPGLQIVAKLKSMGFGVLLVIIATGSLVGYLKSHDAITGLDSEVYAFAFGCLIINFGFTLALDQVVWNLSLEAMVKASDTSASLNTTRFLGSTSGMMLSAMCLFKTPTNTRSRWLLWISLLQAAVVRVFFVAAIGMSNNERFKPAQGRNPWLFLFEFWAPIIGPSIGIPFSLFLIVPLRIPVSDLDGWRLAKVLEGTSEHARLAYGVRDGRAYSGEGVQAFSKGMLA
ncbi:hypothetical protein FDECE_16912 [Fusarium decemcellulare]|nr:hypothetical protein FDECE_16912 [Fusarium decemcellulare]